MPDGAPVSLRRRLPRARSSFRALLAAGLCALALLPACAPELPVAVTREVVHLHGTPYERGKQHGTILRDKVRAFYTKLLASALLPNLNREQPSIAGFLVRYQQPEYADGKFSYAVLLEMAQSIEPQLPEAVRDELHGLADGSGLTYEEVLILNTFADSVLAVRAIAATLKLSHGPQLQSVQFVGMKRHDGTQQKPHEYVALPTALTTSVPTDAALQLVYTDAEGVNVPTLRLQIDEALYTAESAGVTVDAADPLRVVVTVAPPGGWPAASAVAVLSSVADTTIAANPPPAHPRFGRDEGFTFTTAGDTRAAAAVPNIAPDDGRSRPPPVAVGLRGSALAPGVATGPLLGQHFALLDAGAAHETTVILVHHPEQGGAYATVGWAGLIFGFSGMSEAGLGYVCNFSDTLDNAILKDLLPQVSDLPSAKLTATGWPMGLAMRQVLAADATVDAARDRLATMQHVMGWTCLLADKSGAMRNLELDADARLIPAKTVQGVFEVPEALAGVGGDPDMLGIAVHYREHVVDVDTAITTVASALLAESGLNVRIASQSIVSTYWLKSLRTAHRLGEALAAGRGSFDLPKLQALLAEPQFVDQSDSMNAVILDPASGTIHDAMGMAPATDAPWRSFRFGDAP